MSQQSAVADTISLMVNGETRSIPAGWTLADLLSSHSIDARMVVVEHNRNVLRNRDEFGALELAVGDSIEIVHFVGGG